MSIERLRMHRDRYVASLEHFHSLTKYLESVEPSDSWHAPLSVDDDHLGFTLQFTDTKIGCKFSYVRGIPKITYGYFAANQSGTEVITPTSVQIIDHHGNLTNSNDPTTGWEHSMKDGSEDLWFYPKVFKALEASWDYLEPQQAEE